MHEAKEQKEHEFRMMGASVSDDRSPSGLGCLYPAVFVVSLEYVAMDLNIHANTLVKNRYITCLWENIEILLEI